LVADLSTQPAGFSAWVKYYVSKPSALKSTRREAVAAASKAVALPQAVENMEVY